MLENSINSICVSIQSPESICERTLCEMLQGDGECVANHYRSHARGLVASLPQTSSSLVAFLFIYLFSMFEEFIGARFVPVHRTTHGRRKPFP